MGKTSRTTTKQKKNVNYKKNVKAKWDIFYRKKQKRGDYILLSPKKKIRGWGDKNF